MTKFLKLFFLSAIASIAIFAACTKDSNVTVDAAVDQALYSAQERGGLGKYGCYELIFPVTILLPDSTTVETNSYEDIKTALRNYFQSQGTQPHHSRPHLSFVYPISVLSQDGEIITVDNQDSLQQLRRACAGATFGHHNPSGHGQHGVSCFELVFPITIVFPDSTTATANDRMEMRQIIRQWRQNNPGATARPQIGFPITVKMNDDGTLVTVNSREELHQLKEDCE